MLLFSLGEAAVATVVIFLLLRKCARQRQQVRRLESAAAKQENVLRESEYSRKLMFQSNPYPMWIYDCETLRFLTVNDAAVRAYGFSKEEFLTMTLLDIRPPDDADTFLEVARQRHDGYNRGGIWRHCHKDGTTVLVEIIAFEFMREGRLLELVLAMDVTERCAMEAAVRDSQAQLQSLVDNAPFGIAQSSLADNRIHTLNPALCNILGGYTAEEGLQLKVAEEIYADPKDRDRLLEVLRRSRKIQGWETSLRRRDGSLVPVRVTGTLNRLRDGEPEVFSSYVEDLTQQSSLEKQVRQVQKLEAVGRLAGGMAHDFNNILVVIKLSTELMLGQITPENAFCKPLLQISTATDRAAALTRQMLAFGRQQIMQARIINLNSVVSQTTQMLQRVIGEDITLVTNLSDTVENSRLDPDQVSQVILNLAVNARDAMPDGGTLHIETAMVELDEAYTREHPPVQPGRYVMLAVSDSGSGIDKSILPRIFDPFFTTKELGKGTGLGLSIVYGIVKQSGGYIWVYSEAGQGTTFKLYFPTTNAALDKPGPLAEATSRSSGQVLLLVDDDASIRCNVRECLEQLGYRVLEADSGASALEICKLEAGRIDLVLTDLVMGGKSGHALANDLAERFPAIRVLFMSGYTEDSATRREILMKGSPFLQKPFSVAELSQVVHHALMMGSISS